MLIPMGGVRGLRRIQEQGLKAHVLPLPGTSEDVTMLLAYEKGAALIVTVGSHSEYDPTSSRKGGGGWPALSW